MTIYIEKTVEAEAEQYVKGVYNDTFKKYDPPEQMTKDKCPLCNCLMGEHALTEFTTRLPALYTNTSIICPGHWLVHKPERDQSYSDANFKERFKEKV